MTMYKVRDDLDRLYVLRREGRRGLASTEDIVDASIQRFKDYIQKCGEKLITAIRGNTDTTRTKRTTITRKQKWTEKQIHGRF